MPSNVLATVIDDVRVQHANQTADKHEDRALKFGVLELVQKQNSGPDSLVTADIVAKATESQGVALTVDVVKAGTVTIGNTRSCAMPDGGIESDKKTITFATHTFPVFGTPAQYGSNRLAYINDIRTQFNRGIRDLKKVLAANAISLLDTEKNTVYTDVSGRYYAVDANTLLIPAAEEDQLFNTLPSIMEELDYDYNLDFLMQPILMPNARHFSQQGSGNSTNLGYQYNGLSLFSDRRLNAIARTVTNDPDGAGALTASNVKGTLFALAPGSIGMITRTDPDARMNHKANGKEWYEEFIPELGFNVGVLYQDSCSDASAFHAAGVGVSHLTATKTEGWLVSVDVAWLSNYHSAGQARPILKAEVLQ